MKPKLEIKDTKGLCSGCPKGMHNWFYIGELKDKAIYECLNCSNLMEGAK